MNKILSKGVTFELAKLLKEKGFDYHSLYNDFSDNYDYFDKTVQGRVHVSDFSEDKFPDIDKWFPVPYISQIIDWLYEKYNFWVTVEMDYSYSSEKIYFYGKVKWFEENYLKTSTTDSFNSQIEAYINTIKYCLEKLIKIVKNENT